MEMGKNIKLMVNQNMKEHFQMEKGMEKERNFIKMVQQNLKENIYIILNIKENIILIKNQNMKACMNMETNGMEKDTMNMEI